MLVRIHVYVGTRISSDSACSFTTVAAISVLFGETHDAPKCDQARHSRYVSIAFLSVGLKCCLLLPRCIQTGHERRPIRSDEPSDYDFWLVTLSLRAIFCPG